MYRFAALLAFLCLAPAAKAAEIQSRDLGDGVHLITVIGTIEAGDEERFRTLALRHEQAIVALASEGGALTPALEIGRLINLRGYVTAVFNSFTCSSACALIWTAGTKRFLHAGGRVGFHASHYESGGRKIEGGIGNALVGRYLTQLGMAERTIVFSTMATPDSITWLTKENKEQAGISFDVPEGAGGLAGLKALHPPAAATATASTARAHSGWVPVAHGASASFYMDPARLGWASHYRTGWERVDRFHETQAAPREERNLLYFHCAGRRMALKSFNEHDRTGAVVQRGEIADRDLEWFSVAPDTVAEGKLLFACAR